MYKAQNDWPTNYLLKRTRDIKVIQKDVLMEL